MPTKPEGLPAYGFESLLELADMATVTMLRRRRRELSVGQKPVGCFWTGHDYALLYRASEARDMPPMSPGRQRLYDANRTCGECGRKATDPWEKGRDGRRYCPTCQGPVHERLWAQERERDKPIIAAWASGVLADPGVVLVGGRRRQWYREVYAADLTGDVLLQANVFYTTDAETIAQIRERFDGDGVVSATEVVDQVAALADRRVVSWSWSTDGRDLGDGVPSLSPDRVDLFGHWYDRWHGELAGSSHRWDPRVKQQPCPWEPVEQVTGMRELLPLLAGEATP